MANKPKIKGTKAEVAVRDYLRANGYPYAERLALSGALDRGDITGVDPRVVIEVKDHKELLFGPWMHEVHAEVLNADADIGVVWAKRRLHTDPSHWFVCMEGHTFVRLLKEYTG